MLPRPLAPIPQAGWGTAGAATAQLLDSSRLRKRYQIARQLRWGPSKLSRIVNGHQRPTAEDLDALEGYLTDHLPGFIPGTAIGLWTAAPDAGVSVDAGSAEDPLRGPAGWRPWALMVGSAIVACALLVAGWAVARSAPQAGPAGAPCLFDVGESHAGNAEVVAPYVEPFRAAHRNAGGDQQAGCGAGTMDRWQDLVVQPLALPDGPSAVIVAAHPDRTLVMSWSAWNSYRQVGGKSGDNAQHLAGLPAGHRTEAGLTIIDLDIGGALVGEERDGPYFWIPAVGMQALEAYGGITGDLGRPTTYPQIRGDSFVLDLERGWIELGADGGVEVHRVADPQGDLHELGLHAGDLVRQSDATAWRVTSAGARQWIPDGGVWACLGGWDALAGNDVRGWVIAAMPYDGTATCP